MSHSRTSSPASPPASDTSGRLKSGSQASSSAYSPARAPGVSIEDFLDQQPIGAPQILAGLILTLVMLVDGYDLSLSGVMLPAIAHSMAVAPSALTSVVVAQQLGLLVGVLCLGPLSDRFGRRRMLLVCLTALSFLTLLAAGAKTPDQLAAIRFTSSLFFSGLIPNCVTLTLETFPKSVQATATTLVFAGYVAGPFIGAEALAHVNGSLGWQGAFYLGALLVLILIPFVWVFVPESLRFLASRNPAEPRLRAALARLRPDLALAETEILTTDAAPSRPDKPSPWQLLSGQFRWAALLIAATYFTSFLANQMTGNWETTILVDGAHASVARTGLVVFLITLSGVIGTVLCGAAMDRWGAARVLTVSFLVTTILLIALWLTDLTSNAALVLFFAFGFSMSVALVGLNAFAGMCFPATMRVTAIAWGSAAGRLGSTLGSLLGGIVIGTKWLSPSDIFFVAAAPALLAGGIMVIFERSHRS